MVRQNRHMDANVDSVPSRGSNLWPFLFFLAGIEVLNLAFFYLTNDPMGMGLLLGTFWQCFVIGQLLFATLLGGILGKTWGKGVTIGSLIATFWTVSLLLSLGPNSQFAIVNRSTYPVVFAIPAVVFFGSTPLLYCRYAFGWQLSRNSDSLSKNQPIGIQSFLLVVLMLSFMTSLCLLPLVLLGLPISSALWPFVVTSAACATSCLMIVIPLLLVAFRFQARHRQSGYLGVIIAAGVIPTTIFVGFQPAFLLVVPQVGLAVFLPLFLGVQSLKLSGYRLTCIANTQSAPPKAWAPSLPMERDVRWKWIIALAILCGLSFASIFAIKVVQTRIDMAPLELYQTMVRKGGSINVAGQAIVGMNFGPETTDSELANFQPIFNVVSISLANSKVTDEGLDALEKYPNLNHVDLSNTSITDLGLVKLHRIGQLTALNLASTKVTLQGLVDAKLPQHCRTLDLSGLGLTDDQLAILSNTAFIRVRQLYLRDNKFTDSGLVEFFQKTRIPYGTLDLSGNPIDGSCLVDVSAAELILEGLPLTDSGMESLLAKAKGKFRSSFVLGRNNLTEGILTKLGNYLELRGGCISDTQLRNCKVMSLEKLRLTGRDHTCGCFETWHPKINRLALDGSGLSDDTVKFLANLSMPTSLNLADTQITDAALPYLSEACDLNLSNTRVTFEGLKKAKFPRIHRIQVAIGQFSISQIKPLKTLLPVEVGNPYSLDFRGWQ